MAGGPVVRATVLAVALAACGSSERSSDGDGNERGGAQTGGNSGTGGSGQAGMVGGGGAATGGSSGNGTGGTATAGASGSSVGGKTGRSQTEACIAYAAATCRRRDECSGIMTSEPYPCSTSCPDVVFAPGSTRTVDGLFECAEVYATWPCEDILADRLPPCVTPGTKQTGEPCSFASQCQSLECKLSGGRCGSCARLVAENEDCTPPDAACAAGFLCTNGVCRPQSPTIKQPGEPCASFADCDQINSHCNEQGICELYPGENESCAALNKCTSEFYCASADHICRPRPGVDQPCADDAAVGHACAAGLLCLAPSIAEPGTCVAPITVEEGGDCTSPTSFCVAGATCVCIDRTTCPEKRCVSSRLIGQSCTATEPCDPVLDCVDGTCVPGDYQDIFEGACGQ